MPSWQPRPAVRILSSGWTGAREPVNIPFRFHSSLTAARWSLAWPDRWVLGQTRAAIRRVKTGSVASRLVALVQLGFFCCFPWNPAGRSTQVTVGAPFHRIQISPPTLAPSQVLGDTEGAPGLSRCCLSVGHCVVQSYTEHAPPSLRHPRQESLDRQALNKSNMSPATSVVAPRRKTAHVITPPPTVAVPKHSLPCFYSAHPSTRTASSKHLVCLRAPACPSSLCNVFR